MTISSSTNKLINAGRAHVEILCPGTAIFWKQLGLKGSQLGLVRRDAHRLPCGQLRSFGSGELRSSRGAWLGCGSETNEALEL